MRLLVLFIMTIFLISNPVYAKGQSEIIKDVENYLNNIHTMKANFIQSGVNVEDVMATGMFYLKRPGRLRFEYNAPYNDIIVADGVMIHFYDAELESVSNAPISSTLADFLLRKEITLSDDVSVVKVFRKNKLLNIMLTLNEDPEAGSLTLGFYEDPLQLAKWSVLDAQGNVTDITLTKIENDNKLDPSLFVFKSPNGAQGYNE